MRKMTASVVRVPWHSRHSGYDRLLDFLPDTGSITAPRSAVGRRLASLAHKALGPHCPLPFYPPEHFATDMNVLIHPGPVHVLYGDEQFWYSRLRRAPTAVTYHQPPALLAELLPSKTWSKVLDRADQVVVLEPGQQEFFANYIPAERVHLVPHGVDTTVFAPGGQVDPGVPAVVLTVGWWLRDWTTLEAVHDLLHRRHGSAVELVVITRHAAETSWHEAATVLEGVSERELVGWYRKAAVALLPLTDASANNAMLEAMACGVPVVASDIGGVAHYAGQGPGVMRTPPTEPEQMVESVEKILGELDTARYTSRRSAAREQALSFAWPRIAEQIRGVYRLLEDPR